MCGIAGCVSKILPSENQLLRSAERMKHRGPDAQGILQRKNTALVFRRLSILDLSPEGNQPMSNESGDVWTVFNGEIYNFQLLRSQLQSRHNFHSKTDTEVLVHGYEEWGMEGLLARIDGMFAFAIWDESKQELFLARDRVGKKPLYYASIADGIAFASTINSLKELLPETPEIDLQALDEYLIYQAIPAPRTIYKGISMLPPAHWVCWKEGNELKPQRYWQVSYAHKQKRHERDIIEELDILLREAVERRLVADVPLGAFLSGGVDSSLIVGIMSSLGAGPVEAVIIGFEDPAYDERPFARIAAEKSGARLHECVLSPDEMQHLPEIVWHYGQPLADVSIIPTYAVARAAREHITVVLNGDGGDEVFGGYSRPIIARAAQDARQFIPEPLRRSAAKGMGFVGKKGRMLGEAIQGSGRENFVYTRGFRGLRNELYTPELLDSVSDPDSHYQQVWDMADGMTDADRALYGDLTTYLPDQLLVKMDVSTMAHSVEARSPLLDTKLIEYAASIPTEQLIRGYKTKPLLKKVAERYVPKEILYRRKRGFVMPVAEWLRGSIWETTRTILTSKKATNRGLFHPQMVERILKEHHSGKKNWADPIWTLLVLEIWQLLFVDGTLSPGDLLSVLG